MEYSLWKDTNYLSSVPHSSSFPGAVTYAGSVLTGNSEAVAVTVSSSPLSSAPTRQWLRLNTMAFYPCSQVVIVSSSGALLRPRIKLPFACPPSLLFFLRIQWKISRLDWTCQLLMNTSEFPFHFPTLNSWALSSGRTDSPRQGSVPEGTVPPETQLLWTLTLFTGIKVIAPELSPAFSSSSPRDGDTLHGAPI